MKKVSGLGKGLSALISERKIDITEYAETKGKKSELNIDEVFPGRFQPRTIFDKGEMEELAESVRRNGVLQPILVRKRQGQGYEIIAGERRWRASKMAKLQLIPAIILDVDNKQAMEIALIENVQRQNLTILEEAEGYKRLISEFEYTQEQLGDVVGKSRSHITNILRLMGLPEEVKLLLNDGKISSGHARALLVAQNPLEAAQEVIKRNYSVRQTENYIKKISTPEGGSFLRKKYIRKRKNDEGNKEIALEVISNITNIEDARKPKEPEILMMEGEISEKSGFAVEINNSDETGEVIIKYSSMEELYKILTKLEG
jgi:ParB family chromosome partitioning protein